MSDEVLVIDGVLRIEESHLRTVSPEMRGAVRKMRAVMAGQRPADDLHEEFRHWDGYRDPGTGIGGLLLSLMCAAVGNVPMAYTMALHTTLLNAGFPPLQTALNLFRGKLYVSISAESEAQIVESFRTREAFQFPPFKEHIKASLATVGRQLFAAGSYEKADEAVKFIDALQYLTSCADTLENVSDEFRVSAWPSYRTALERTRSQRAEGTHQAALEAWDEGKRRANTFDSDAPGSFEFVHAYDQQVAVPTKVEIVDRLMEVLASCYDGSRPVSLLDMGCGGGGMLARVGQLAGQRGLPVSLHGVEPSPVAARHCREVHGLEGVALAPINAFLDGETPTPERIDVISICGVLGFEVMERGFETIVSTFLNRARHLFIADDVINLEQNFPVVRNSLYVLRPFDHVFGKLGATYQADMLLNRDRGYLGTITASL
jgi:hypothetical protein